MVKEEKIKKETSYWPDVEWHLKGFFYYMSLSFRDLKSFARRFEHFIKRGLACSQLPSSARMMKMFSPHPRVYASNFYNVFNGFPPSRKGRGGWEQILFCQSFPTIDGRQEWQGRSTIHRLLCMTKTIWSIIVHISKH